MNAKRGRTIAFGVVLALVAGSALAMTLGIRAASVYLKKLPVDAPRLLSAMHPESESFVRVGEDQLESPETLETLGTDNYLTRTYRVRGTTDPKRDSFSLHAAYYTGMIDTVPHVPERCFIGAGLQKADVSEVVPIPLDLGPGSPFRLEESGYPGSTPEALRPIEREDGSRDVYWLRTSNTHSSRKGEFVRVSFDPATLRMRVSKFLNPDGVVYSGYFFIANGGITPSAEGVRQLAFKLEDKHAYYLKVQFTSTGVGSASELAELAGRFLDENLAELLLCVPDWIEVSGREVGGG